MRKIVLKDLSFRIVIALLIQFIVGMFVNLFVNIPKTYPGANSSNFFLGIFPSITWALTSSYDIALILHILIGIALLIGSTIVLIISIKQREKIWIILTSIGLLGILSASFNGVSFIIYDQEINSFVMSVGLLVSIFSYTLGIYLS